MRTQIVLIGCALLLSACSGGGMAMDRGNMGHGMQHGGDTMHGNAGTAFVIGAEEDLMDLPVVKPSEEIAVQNGDSIELEPTIVRMDIGGTWVAMYGYNGMIPGPTIVAPQGATFSVNVRNDIDQPTTIHWHGVRVDNRFDGAAGQTQEAIEPGESYTYDIDVPDSGIYWYHPHVREDIQQEGGLYGAILVRAEEDPLPAVDAEQLMFLDDLAVDITDLPDGSQEIALSPFGNDKPTQAMMGRFGSMNFVNGILKTGGITQTYSIDQPSVLRLYLINAANTRTYKLRVVQKNGGRVVPLRVVALDGGTLQKPQRVNDVILSPSERAVVDVPLDRGGDYLLRNDPLGVPSELAVFYVALNAKDRSPLLEGFDTGTTKTDFPDVADAYAKAPDHTVRLDMVMHGMNGGMMMHGEATPDGIEWVDTNPMNAMMDGSMVQWKLVDADTGAENENIHYVFRKGDMVKLRFENPSTGTHPMQHPMHLHGQRFLVLSDNGVKNTNLAWKDTVLVPAGHTVDILMEASNPGEWMFHCHIAEHLTNGMMGTFTVEP